MIGSYTGKTPTFTIPDIDESGMYQCLAGISSPPQYLPTGATGYAAAGLVYISNGSIQWTADGSRTWSLSGNTLTRAASSSSNSYALYKIA